jgi:hypothetical protein
MVTVVKGWYHIDSVANTEGGVWVVVDGEAKGEDAGDGANEVVAGTDPDRIDAQKLVGRSNYPSDLAQVQGLC